MKTTAFSPSLPIWSSHPPTTLSSKPARTPHARARFFARAERRSENVPGNLFVDSSCIDCDTCRWLAPLTFHSANQQSAVYAQPDTHAALLRAMQAAAACPTGSIRTEEPERTAREGVHSFPTPALDAEDSPVPGVYYNGFAAKETAAGSSWLVTTSEGNVMFDCPRFFEPLAKRIEEMGGLRYIVMSHRDDVAGHDRWAERFGAERVIHEAECSRRQGTHACEVQLKDTDFEYELMPGLRLLHLPGHTSGSIAMLHEATKSLLTGDHLAGSEREGELTAFPRYCHFSWGTQMESIGKLEEVDFLHGFPGHGRPFHFKDAEQRRRELAAAVEAFGSVRSVRVGFA